MNNVDRDSRYSVKLCKACKGAGKVASVTHIVKHADDVRFTHLTSFRPCTACAGTGEAGDPVLTARVRSRQLLNTAALVRVLDKVSR